jgi:hypothetical protein
MQCSYCESSEIRKNGKSILGIPSIIRGKSLNDAPQMTQNRS